MVRPSAEVGSVHRSQSELKNTVTEKKTAVDKRVQKNGQDLGDGGWKAPKLNSMKRK